MANGSEIVEVSGEMMPDMPSGQVIGILERATVDMQITTAHQYPRSMATFKKRAMEMVTLDEETAQSCLYRRPVGKKFNKETGKSEVEFAEGKSIRLAEIVGACYGNLRVGAMLVEQNPRFVKARGVAHDLESNFAASCEVVESTVTKEGQPYSERMRVVVAKACLAKARRDATFQVVPGALCKSLEEAARLTAIGTEATLGKRRTLVLDWINKAGIEPGRVWNALGINGIEDIGINELEVLTGIRTAIKDGDTNLDEAFPDKSNDEKAIKKAQSIVEKSKAAKSGSTAPAAPPASAPVAPVAPAATEAPQDPLTPPMREPGQDEDSDLATTDQVVELDNLIRENKIHHTQWRSVFKTLGISKLEELPKAKYAEAKKRLLEIGA